MRIPVNQEERKIVKRLIQGINQDRSEKIKRDKVNSEKRRNLIRDQVWRLDKEKRVEIDYEID